MQEPEEICSAEGRGGSVREGAVRLGRGFPALGGGRGSEAGVLPGRTGAGGAEGQPLGGLEEGQVQGEVAGAEGRVALLEAASEVGVDRGG